MNVNLRGGRLPALPALVLIVFSLLPGCSGRKSRVAAVPPAQELEPTLRAESAGSKRLADNDPAPARAEVLPIALEITLQNTFLKPGQKLNGSVSGGLEKGDYVLLWLDGSSRIAAAYQIDNQEHARNSQRTSFDIEQPPGLLAADQKLLVVRILNGRTDSKGKYELSGQAGFSLAAKAAHWNGFVTLVTGEKNGSISGALTIGRAIPDAVHPLRPAASLKETFAAYARTRSASLLERKPPLFDEAALGEVQSAIDHFVAAAGNSSRLWSIGDEISLTAGAAPFDFDTSSASLALFQAWLETRHRSLDELNERWGARYRSWAEITAPTTDVVKAAHSPLYAESLAALIEQNRAGAATPAGAAQRKFEERDGLKGFSLTQPERRVPGGENFAAWCDWREFNDFAFARLLREFRAKLGESAAHHRVQPMPAGMLNACGPSPWGGWDWWQISRSVDWAHSSAPLVPELVSSFAAPANPVRTLTPLDPASSGSRVRLWQSWLSGVSGVTLGSVPEDRDSALVTDLRERLPGLTLLRDAAGPSQDAVAIYYSPRSLQLHWMLDSEADGSWWLHRTAETDGQKHSGLLALTTWQLLLKDLGYTPRFLHPQQLLAGQLRRSKNRVLILPKVLSLSRDEVRVIRDFARAGGIVIADGACGTFDASGTRAVKEAQLAKEPQPAGSLDKDFGIARSSLRTYEINGAYAEDDHEVGVTLKDAPDSAPTGPRSPELRILEPGLLAAGGRAHAFSDGGTPALLTNAGGLGRFIYLNLALQDYAQLRESSANGFSFSGMPAADYAARYGEPTGGEALRLIVGDILVEALGESAVSVRDEKEIPLRGVLRTRVGLGKGVQLISVLPGPGTKEQMPIAVRQSRESHWYDISSGNYLGQGSSAKTQLQPDQPVTLAALPYRVERVSVRVRRTDPRGIFKISASLITRDGQPGSHAFYIQVLDESRKPLAQYERVELAENGLWKGDILLALNEPAGHYHIIVRDILTGARGEGHLDKDTADFVTLFPR
ncbi:MAG TPA: beta-galactosidase [Planctomycetota bacterium]|nr:beta-galactosidase [Planctomycetota bacterium]